MSETLALKARWGPFIAAGGVEHGSKGECPEPELCMALIEGRIAHEAEFAQSLRPLLSYGAEPPEYPGLVLVPKADMDAARAVISEALA